MSEIHLNLIKSPTVADLDNSKYFIAFLEGKRSKSIEAFLHEVGEIFNSPAYYGENMNAFYECINDLSWINQPNCALIIKDYSEFLADEPDGTSKEYLLILNDIAKEWENVPNFIGEDEFRKKSIFKVLIVEDKKVIRDLKLLAE